MSQNQDPDKVVTRTSLPHPVRFHITPSTSTNRIVTSFSSTRFSILLVAGLSESMSGTACRDHRNVESAQGAACSAGARHTVGRRRQVVLPAHTWSWVAKRHHQRVKHRLLAVVSDRHALRAHGEAVHHSNRHEPGLRRLPGTPLLTRKPQSNEYRPQRSRRTNPLTERTPPVWVVQLHWASIAVETMGSPNQGAWF